MNFPTRRERSKVSINNADSDVAFVDVHKNAIEALTLIREKKNQHSSESNAVIRRRYKVHEVRNGLVNLSVLASRLDKSDKYSRQEKKSKKAQVWLRLAWILSILYRLWMIWEPYRNLNNTPELYFSDEAEGIDWITRQAYDPLRPTNSTSSFPLFRATWNTARQAVDQFATKPYQLWRSLPYGENGEALREYSNSTVEAKSIDSFLALNSSSAFRAPSSLLNQVQLDQQMYTDLVLTELNRLNQPTFIYHVLIGYPLKFLSYFSKRTLYSVIEGPSKAIMSENNATMYSIHAALAPGLIVFARLATLCLALFSEITLYSCLKLVFGREIALISLGGIALANVMLTGWMVCPSPKIWTLSLCMIILALSIKSQLHFVHFVSKINKLNPSDISKQTDSESNPEQKKGSEKAEKIEVRIPIRNLSSSLLLELLASCKDALPFVNTKGNLNEDTSTDDDLGDGNMIHSAIRALALAFLSSLAIQTSIFSLLFFGPLFCTMLLSRLFILLQTKTRATRGYLLIVASVMLFSGAACASWKYLGIFAQLNPYSGDNLASMDGMNIVINLIASLFSPSKWDLRVSDMLSSLVLVRLFFSLETVKGLVLTLKLSAPIIIFCLVLGKRLVDLSSIPSRVWHVPKLSVRYTFEYACALQVLVTCLALSQMAGRPNITRWILPLLIPVLSSFTVLISIISIRSQSLDNFPRERLCGSHDGSGVKYNWDLENSFSSTNHDIDIEDIASEDEDEDEEGTSEEYDAKYVKSRLKVTSKNSCLRPFGSLLFVPVRLFLRAYPLVIICAIAYYRELYGSIMPQIRPHLNIEKLPESFSKDVSSLVWISDDPRIIVIQEESRSNFASPMMSLGLLSSYGVERFLELAKAPLGVSSEAFIKVNKACDDVQQSLKKWKRVDTLSCGAAVAFNATNIFIRPTAIVINGGDKVNFDIANLDIVSVDSKPTTLSHLLKYFRSLYTKL